MLSDASAAPASCLLPPCPLVAASYEPVLQSISSPAVSITTQLGEEELPVSSICPSPGVSLVSGSSAGSHWLSRRARERPLGAGSVRRGSRQRSAAPGSPGRPAGERGVSRSCPGSTEPEAAAQRERVLRTAPPEVCGRTGARERESERGPARPPKHTALPSPVESPWGGAVGLGLG